MINFKEDEDLGKVIDKRQLFSFGAAPITSFKEIVFAAGGHKFSSLCGFKFISKQKQIIKNSLLLSFASFVQKFIIMQLVILLNGMYLKRFLTKKCIALMQNLLKYNMVLILLSFLIQICLKQV